jgi:hypothetical protein
MSRVAGGSPGLGIHPNTLFRKIKSLGNEWPENEGRRRGF